MSSRVKVGMLVVVVVLLGGWGVGIWTARQHGSTSGGTTSKAPETTSSVPANPSPQAPPRPGSGNPVVVRTNLADGRTGFGVTLERTAPAEEPRPPVPQTIEFREYKPQGTKYTCKLQSMLSGRALKDMFKCAKGEADFLCTADLQWESEMVFNDGRRQEEKRTISRARMVNQVYVTNFGLTELGVQIVACAAEGITVLSGGPPGAGYAGGRTVGQLLKAGTLPRIPILGGTLKGYFEQLIKREDSAEVVIYVAQQMLGKIEGHEVICTWDNGKLVGARGIGFALTDEDVRLLNRMSSMADYNILPDTTVKVGDERNVSANTVLEYLLGLADTGDNCGGYLKLVRDNDLTPGVTAVVNGAGNCRYNGNLYEGSATIQSLKANVSYAGETRKDRNVFLTSCSMEGTAHITRTDADLLLANIKTIADPRLSVNYECVLKK